MSSVVEPAAITGSDKALMYALSGLARSGATRSNYISRQTTILLDGVATGSNRPWRVLVASLTIQDVLNETPNTCTFTVQGDRPREGASIVIAFGSTGNPSRLFAGSVIRVQQVYTGKPANVLYQLEGIDWTWGLNAKLVNARYRSQSATVIGYDLVTRFAPAGYTAHVAAGLPQIDEISFTNTPLMDAFAQLANRIGGYARCDYFKAVWLWVTTPPDAPPAPRALTPDHPSLSNVSYTRDLSQVVTRAVVEGGGVNALGPVNPGETRLPVDDVAWYPAGGGWVTSGPQRIRYTGVVVPGPGSAVGGPQGNVQPTAPPTVGSTPGTGLPAGTYQYAYTWATAAGETKPSPVAAFTNTQAGGPPAPPTLTLQTTGTALGVGRYRYAFTFGTAAGETMPSPIAEVTTGTSVTAAPTTGPTAYMQTGGGLTSLGFYFYRVTFVTATGETTTGPPSQDGFWLYQGYGTVDLRNIPIGPANVTGRRIYRTRAQGGANPPSDYYLVTTLADNTTTTYLDTKADGALGVQRPATNTTTISSRQVALSAIVAGPAGTTRRKVYRTVVGGTTLQLLTTLENNTTTTFTDATPDASLGAAAPTTGTAVLAQATVSNVAVGPTTVTSRKIYRSPVNSSLLKLLTTLANNTATAMPGSDTTADASLGTAAPVTDTSGLTSGAVGGQVNAGATTMPVSNTAPFSPEGWALVGDQLIRYRGVTGTDLTGIPATGIGSIGISIPYQTVVAVVAQLTGIPASGSGAIVIAILGGDPVNLLAIVDDLPAQAVLAGVLGTDGIIEGYLQDRRISYGEALSRAQALLALRSTVRETLRYRCRDPQTFSGATITVNLPAPTNIVASYQVQDVTINNFGGRGDLFPVYEVVASSSRFSFEDLIRQRRALL